MKDKRRPPCAALREQREGVDQCKIVQKCDPVNFFQRRNELPDRHPHRNPSVCPYLNQGLQRETGQNMEMRERERKIFNEMRIDSEEKSTEVES